MKHSQIYLSAIAAFICISSAAHCQTQPVQIPPLPRAVQNLDEFARPFYHLKRLADQILPATPANTNGCERLAGAMTWTEFMRSVTSGGVSSPEQQRNFETFWQKTYECYCKVYRQYLDCQVSIISHYSRLCEEKFSAQERANCYSVAMIEIAPHFQNCNNLYIDNYKKMCLGA